MDASGKLQRMLPVIGLLVLCTLFYWKLVLTDQYVWFDHPDMCYIELPRLQFQAREMHSGRFPLWDPYIWMGQPLIGQTQPGPLFPLNILFFFLPFKDGYLDFRALNWYYVIIHFIAAASAYALCRDLLRSRAASIFAACLFAFGGFIGTVGWLDVVNGAIWTPAICLFFLRAARGIRPTSNAAFGGLVLAVAWLSGHHEIPMLVSYALAVGWAYTIWRQGRAAVLPAAIMFVIAGLVAAIQLWPTFEFAQVSERWIGLEHSVKFGDTIPYTSPAGYSLPLRGLLGTALSEATTYADSAPFLGLIAVLLAVYAVCAGWRLPPVRWMLALAIASAVYALGALTPVHGLLFTFAPLLGKARVPVRAIHLLNFALAVLAAYGLDRLLAHAEEVWLRRIVVGMYAMAGIIFAATIWRKDMPDGVVAGGMVALCAAILLAAFQRRRVSRTALVCSLLALMLFELYPVATATFANRHDKSANRFVKSLTENRDVVKFLRSEPGPRRLTVNDTDVPTNFGDWNGFDVMEGYVAGVTSNLMRLGRHTKPVQDLFGITHHVGKTPDRPDQVEVFTGATGVKVFRAPSAFPRAWSVHNSERVPDVNARLGEAGFDARRTVLMLTEIPPLERCDGDTVDLVARGINRIRLRASMRCRGMVVLSETFYPGWEAKVDGRAVPIHEAYGALRGVIVDGGDHSIDMVYRPMSVYGGGAITITGLIAAAWIAGLARRRLRRP